MRMRASVPPILAFVFTLVGIAQSQNSGLSNSLPSCSLGCFQTAINESGCSMTDTICQCTTGKNVITDQVTVCLESGQSGCSGQDLENVISQSSAICSEALAAKPSDTTSSAAASSSPPTSRLAADGTLTMSVAPTLTSSGTATAQTRTGAASRPGVGPRDVGLGLAGAFVGLLAL